MSELDWAEVHRTAPKLARIPASDVKIGDAVVSLAGWRPVTRIQRHRKGLLTIRTTETRHKLPMDRLLLVHQGVFA